MSNSMTSDETLLFSQLNGIVGEYGGMINGKVLTVVEAAMEPSQQLEAVKSLISTAIYDTISHLLDETCAVIANLADHRGDREDFDKFWGYRATRNGEYTVEWPSEKR